MDKRFHVISHTHWDREWYMPLSHFRFKLVDLIDHCLDTLDEYPDYVFHLDAQTIVLEDYLSIRPERKEKLKERIRAGRLLVGPWYLQNDFYLVSGESTIRNLLEGRRMAEEFGKCSMVGYAPDQFGNISQLPQILAGFGIHNFVFGRGYSFYDEKNKRIPKNSEFIWRGADGTEVLAVHMTFWYNNAQRFSQKEDTSRLLLEVTKRLFKDIATTPHLLLMNGVDHLEAQNDLLPILEKLQQQGYDVAQTSLESYIATLEEFYEKNSPVLQKHEGELRSGNDWELLKGTLSSRSYLKRINVQAQDLLEAKLEPLYAMLEANGARGAYSQNHFRFLWKELMQNHPHDSICGCSRDEVHAHMEDSYERFMETGQYMLESGMRIATEHYRFAKDTSEKEYTILVLNTTQKEQSKVIEVELDLLASDKIEQFAIVDEEGQNVEYVVLEEKSVQRDVFSPVNLPGVVDVKRYRLYLYAQDIQGFAARGYRVKKAKKIFPKLAQYMSFRLEEKPFVMENTQIKLTVHPSGKVAAFFKDTGHHVTNLLEWEDRADPGDSYVFFNKDKSKPIMSRTMDAKVVVEEDNQFFQRCTISHIAQLPAEFYFDKKKRGEKLIDCVLSLKLTLPKKGGGLEVDFRVENAAKDHRLRLKINTGLKDGKCYADIPFDVVNREEDEHYAKTMSRVFPSQTFAVLEKEGNGVAVATEGMHEVERIGGHLAFTTLRATGVINRNPKTLQPASGRQWDAPGNQCLRTIEGRFGLRSYQGGYIAAGVLEWARQFRVGLLQYVTSNDVKKFSGGRTAVQDTALEEFFYLPDPYPRMSITENRPFIQVQGEGLIVTATKIAEESKDLIIRILNISTSVSEGIISAKGKLYKTNMAERGSILLGSDAITYRFKPKEILTLRLALHVE